MLKADRRCCRLGFRRLANGIQVVGHLLRPLRKRDYRWRVTRQRLAAENPLRRYGIQFRQPQFHESGVRVPVGQLLGRVVHPDRECRGRNRGRPVRGAGGSGANRDAAHGMQS